MNQRDREFAEYMRAQREMAAQARKQVESDELKALGKLVTALENLPTPVQRTGAEADAAIRLQRFGWLRCQIDDLAARFKRDRWDRDDIRVWLRGTGYVPAYDVRDVIEDFAVLAGLA